MGGIGNDLVTDPSSRFRATYVTLARVRLTDGPWLGRSVLDARYAKDAYELRYHRDALVVAAPSTVIASRGDSSTCRC